MEYVLSQDILYKIVPRVCTLFLVPFHPVQIMASTLNRINLFYHQPLHNYYYAVVGAVIGSIVVAVVVTLLIVGVLFLLLVRMYTMLL